MGSAAAFLLMLMASCTQAMAADELVERASKAASPSPTDLDDTTLMKATKAAPKASVKAPQKNRIKNTAFPKSEFMYIDDPEIWTDKKKTLGGTTRFLAGSGMAAQAKERSIPTYWGGGGNAGRKEFAKSVENKADPFRGLKNLFPKGDNNFVYQDDPEIWTDKKKTLGGTTKDLAGKGMPAQSQERAIPTYWGGKGNKGFNSNRR
jgi:hypothetical protein